jgi:lipid-A-disaccharide synthase
MPGTRVAALGGPRLAAAGAQLLLDRTAKSVVGLGEVAKNLAYFRSLIAATVRWIDAYRPRAVCLVDNSGVNLRIAESLRLKGISQKGGGPVRLLYYISPQVWASRSARRFGMARNLDALAVIFPFEPEVYADTGLPVTFTGHPFMAPDYVPPVAYDPAGPVLLLPGSRVKAVSKIFPALLAGYADYASGPEARGAVVLYPSSEVRARLESFPLPPGVRLQQRGPTVAASAVLTSSGTMSMHCALAGIPGAIVYRIDPFTYLLARWLVQVPFLGIANIILGEAMYPEYLQGAATAHALARELSACVGDAGRRERTTEESARLRSLLSKAAGEDESSWLARNLR